MKKVAKFKKVSLEQFDEDMQKEYYGGFQTYQIRDFYNGIKLPVRKTKGSAGHDICAPFKVTLSPGQTIKIPTGIRCKMEDNYVMFIVPRSSLGIKKHMVLSNTMAVIDSDYYYADNEGHILLQIENHGKEIIELKEGEAFVQCIFSEYGVADEEEVGAKRTGGIGSTSTN